MKSQNGASSYQEFSHGLGAYPGHVQVLLQSTDGSSSGFTFQGHGAAQNQDYKYGSGVYNYYGGVDYGYNALTVDFFILLFFFLSFLLSFLIIFFSFLFFQRFECGHQPRTLRHQL